MFLEREALKLAMQFPALAGPLFDTVDAAAYRDPMHAAVREAIAAAGGVGGAAGGASWVEAIREACADLGAKALVSALAVEPPRYDGEPDPHYVTVTLAGLQLPLVGRRLSELKSKMQRMNPVTEADEYRRLFGDLASLEQQRRGLHEQVIGGL
jgi:DNA primase